MKTFLGTIAEIYNEKHKSELKDFCFIFPNRRSSKFFQKHLTDLSHGQIIFPKIYTISDFINDIARVNIPSNLELIMALYSEYLQLVKSDKDNETNEFEKFIFWGNMILNDFNDVDLYLADAAKVFQNVKDYKDITSNFLTEEQKTVLSLLGYKDVTKNDNDSEQFWKSKIKESFINIWEILFPLYDSFNKRLAKENKAYSGRAYKIALQKLQNTDSKNLNYKRYIFIGFNMLSESEKMIFKYFKDKGIADFYWDYDNIFFKNKSNKGAKFINEYVNLFPSKYALSNDVKEKTNIEIISVPSNGLQTKQASEIISELIKENKVSSVNTAIVVPDEELFIPVLNSIPETEIGTNITCGFPMKYASITSFISSLTRLQKNSKKEKEDWSYFHEDVKNVLSHTYIRNKESYKIRKFINLITSQKRYRINSKELTEYFNDSEILFRPLTDLEDKKQIFDYLYKILSYIESSISDSKVERGLLNFYKKSLSDLETITNNFNFTIKGNVYLYLIGSILSSQTARFEGEPLKGIQIMGVLETRCLDFDNVIILSMNEKIFPRKHFQKSFIPNSLRKAYKLSTVDHQESIFAYYFYRLISKAKNVSLIYDSRTKGLSSGEPSRFIHQLRYIYNDVVNISYKSCNFSMKSPGISKISIKKDEDILKKLSRFKSNDENNREYLSASSIYKYIECPLKFYLSKIEKIKIENEPSDFIEANIFGLIIHDTLKTIYTSEKVINNFELDKIICQKINEYYLNLESDKYDTALEGEALLIADVVKYYIVNVLIYDKYIKSGKYITDLKELPFEIVQCEVKEDSVWNLNEKGENDKDLIFNFEQYIDRVDRYKGQGLRIIDYKTGGDKISINSIPDIFDPQKNGATKGIFQLFLYCNFYAYHNECEEPIKPVLYTIKDIKKIAKEYHIKIDKKEVNNYMDNDYNKEFLEGLRHLIKEIFNPEIPFNQTSNTKKCKNCEYKIICHR